VVCSAPASNHKCFTDPVCRVSISGALPDLSPRKAPPQISSALSDRLSATMLMSVESAEHAPARISPFPAPKSERPFEGLSPTPIETTYTLLKYQASVQPDEDCLGWRPALPADYIAPLPPAVDKNRPFQWWSYGEVLAHATAAGLGLVEKFGLNRGDTVGIYARNCPWWTCTGLALSSQGIIVVPIYDTLGPNVVEYVCNHSEAKLVVVSVDNAPKLTAALADGKCASVASVVVIETDGGVDACAPAIAIAKTFDSGVVMADVVAAGKAAITAGKTPSPGAWDDLLVIMYTSGTTGDPKGVMLKNSAFMASVSTAYSFFTGSGQRFVKSDSFLSYLPLSHIFEQQSEALLMGCGGKIGFYTGDIKLLLDDITALGPTVFAGVPRVFARFQERILASVESGGFIKKKLFEFAYARQLAAERNPVGSNKVDRSYFWDMLVMSKVRAKLLPNARIVITGSAPMSSETNDFLKVCLQCPVVQGYGLTETVGGLVCSAPGASLSGTCGGPMPGSLVRLVDVPDMNYTSADKPYPRGEVCLKGSILTNGYYKNEKETAEAFDADGYFHTGDVGQWLPDGALQIIDRKKNLFKLSQGEYVSPEALEQEYSKCKLVGQIYVYGNSLQSSLLAVVVPDVIAVKEWAKGNAPSISDLPAIVELPDFKSELLAQLSVMRVQSKFKRYEEIKDVVIETDDLNELGQAFHVDNDLMTPSFKLKRPQLNKKYKASLEAIYASKA
jgi:long-chain acyl-CoA synthetase